MAELRLVPVLRQFEKPVVESVSTAVESECLSLLADVPTRAGERIAIAVGSRGIANLPLIVATLVHTCRAYGLQPFLIPAMGSHGGATAAGQTDVLRKLGIDPVALQVEIRADMETELLGTTASGLPVLCAREALQADHVLVCNRIKPHTRFTGTVQSGLQKMLLIGLGKHAGAAACHRLTHHLPFEQLVAEALPIILERAPIRGGLAIIENAAEQTAHIEAIPASQLASREPELLLRAMNFLPQLPVREIDLLIIDEIGKEISGTGMDTNIIGRKFNDHVSSVHDWCQTRLIYIRGITAATGGNATGIGMAEFTHPGVVKQVDWNKTAINCITSGHPTTAMCPVVLPHDRAVLEAASSIIGRELRIVHLRNTLHLDEVFVSENCLPDLEPNPTGMEVGNPFTVEFSAEGWMQHSPLNYPSC